MLHSLPPELRHAILKSCDLLSLLHLRQVSSYYKIFAEDELYTRTRLDISSDYFRLFSDCNSTMDMQYLIHLEKIITFLREYMPNISELSLRCCPTVLTLTNLIQLASVTPNLVALDLSQMCDKPHFEKDAIHALAYFRNLKVLKLDGFIARKNAGRGCAHRVEVPPIKQLRKLEVLEMTCQQDTLSRILFSLRESQSILFNLKRIYFGVQHCSAVYPELLIWFLRTHRSLVSVSIYNALFPTADQLRRFYNALMLLPLLLELRLDSCTSCDRIDSTIQVQFLKAMSSKGVIQEGTVRSE
uniref:F-box domain-containing protein n=1 Tax=Parascaris univalens TaxID=6257 RepID=A0A914ZF20_PARUN